MLLLIGRRVNINNEKRAGTLLDISWKFIQTPLPDK